jgi:predicted acetyltransferase
MTVLRRLGVEELDGVVAIRSVAFGLVDEEGRERLRSYLASGVIWGLEEDGQLLATARLGVQDHWFGGRRVPCQHVGGVAVPPEHRGRGVASALMRAALEQGLAEGAGLSVLFPATTALYRRLGYELAGSFTRLRIDARPAPAIGPPLRPAREEDWDAIRACQQAAHSALNGPAVTDARGWERLHAAPFVYVLDAEDASGIEAYVCYDQVTKSGDWQFTLDIWDQATTTPRGLAALLGLVGRHGTIGKGARLAGPYPHPWSFLTPEQDLERDGGMDWMARGLDLPAAIAARGFVPGFALDVTFAVEDPLLSSARGPWRLEVAAGSGKLAPADTAEVTLVARAVGPLFTGFASPAQLALAGIATGPADALALLGAAFAGPPPIFLEFF